MTYDEIRKYFDAVQFGESQVTVLLPVTFYRAKEKCLTAYQKQVAIVRGNGEVDKAKVDYIPKGLY